MVEYYSTKNNNKYMYIFLIFVVLSLLYCYYYNNNNKVLSSVPNTNNKVLSSEPITNNIKIIIYYFYAPWCPHSNKFNSEWDILYDRLKNNNNYILQKIDCENKDMLNKYV